MSHRVLHVKCIIKIKMKELWSTFSDFITRGYSKIAPVGWTTTINACVYEKKKHDYLQYWNFIAPRASLTMLEKCRLSGYISRAPRDSRTAGASFTPCNWMRNTTWIFREDTRRSARSLNLCRLHAQTRARLYFARACASRVNDEKQSGKRRVLEARCCFSEISIPLVERGLLIKPWQSAENN